MTGTRHMWFMIGASHVVTFHAGAMPEWLGELEGLEVLYLSLNSFRGEQYSRLALL